MFMNMRVFLSLFVVLFVVVLCPLGFAVPADFARPVIVEKPLILSPGELVPVVIYNGGHEVWADFSVSVAGLEPVLFSGIVEPEQSVVVEVPVPLVYLLDNDALEVSLYYKGELLDARRLPVEVIWPAQSVVVDPYGVSGAEIVLLVDASQFDDQLRGVQAEVVLLKDDDIVYFDFYGPFYLGGDEQFYFRTPLPVPSGEYTVRATFFEGRNFLAETTTNVTLLDGRSGVGSLLVVLLTILFIVGLYVLLDSLYNGRSYRESLLKLR